MSPFLNSAAGESAAAPMTRFQCLAIALPALLLGAWSALGAYDALSIGDVVRLDARQVESGTASPGRWNEVYGHLLRDHLHRHRSRRSTSYYVPLVSPAWNRTDKVAIVARFSNLPQENSGSFRGITPTRHGVPASVRQGLAQQGLVLNDNCLLIQADETPSSVLVMQSIGTLVGLCGLGFAVYKWPPSTVALTDHAASTCDQPAAV